MQCWRDEVGETDMTIPQAHSKTAISGPELNPNPPSLPTGRLCARLYFLTTCQKAGLQQNDSKRGNLPLDSSARGEEPYSCAGIVG